MKKKVIIGAAIAAVIIIAIIIVAIVLGNKGYRIISVENYEGDVAVLRGNSSINAIQGMNLVSKDFLNTATDSLATLLIDTDKHIVVSPETEIEIIAVGNENKGKVNVELKKGYASFAVDNKLNDDSTFEVETPNALLAIRGTQFDVIYDDTSNTSIVSVSEGVVHLEAGDESLELTEGNQVIIKDDEIIENNCTYTLEFFVSFDIYDPDFINSYSWNTIILTKKANDTGSTRYILGANENILAYPDGTQKNDILFTPCLEETRGIIYDYYGDDYIKKMTQDICDGVIDTYAELSEYEVPKRITIHDYYGETFTINVLDAFRSWGSTSGALDQTVYTPYINESPLNAIIFQYTIDAASAERMIELMTGDVSTSAEQTDSNILGYVINIITDNDLNGDTPQNEWNVDTALIMIQYVGGETYSPCVDFDESRNITESCHHYNYLSPGTNENITLDFDSSVLVSMQESVVASLAKTPEQFKDAVVNTDEYERLEYENGEDGLSRFYIELTNSDYSNVITYKKADGTTNELNLSSSTLLYNNGRFNLSIDLSSDEGAKFVNDMGIDPSELVSE